MIRTQQLERTLTRILQFLRALCRRYVAWPLAIVVAVAVGGCHSLRLLPPPGQDRTEKVEKDPLPTTPGKYSLRVSQYIFLSDFELKRDLPLFRELAELRDQVYSELQLPGANTVVQVYLFEDSDRYERFMKARYPNLPNRRAFFVAQPRGGGNPEDLIVYTYWGDRIQLDLRHELTHALLHSVLKDVPMWLDEGLAEYYEVPPQWKGVNYQHFDQICRTGFDTFRPDLAKLEQVSMVSEMTPQEYREAWSWVHLMLRGNPEAKKVLLAYLQQLRTNPRPGPLQPRLEAALPRPEEALQRHLAQLQESVSPPPTAQR